MHMLADIEWEFECCKSKKAEPSTNRRNARVPGETGKDNGYLIIGNMRVWGKLVKFQSTKSL